MSSHQIVLLSIPFLLIISCSAFGTAPEGDHLEKIKKSPNYDKQKEVFNNRRPDILEKMKEKNDYWAMTKEYFFPNNKNRKPSRTLPEIKPPNLEEFLKPTDSFKFIWFGHSTLLINFENTILLFDPVLSKSASPFSFMIQRFQPPILKVSELPKIDYVVISHDHYDHLDMETIQYFKDKPTTKFITPLGVTSHIKGWGISSDRLSELDWWETITLGSLELICTPAQHFSGRKGMDLNTLWSSWVIRSKTTNIYFSGDSGYDTHFKQIGDKYGPFDIAFIENGQYNKMWQAVHVLPEETAKAFLDLNGKKLVTIHWAMFELAFHDWYEPIEEIEKYAKLQNIDILTPKIGQLVVLNEDTNFEKWWKELIKR